MKRAKVFKMKNKESQAGKAGNTITLLAMVNLLLAGAALLKDMALASFLGTTAQADAFMLAFYLPDMIGSGLLAASVGIACIPVFTEVSVKEIALREELRPDLSQTVSNIFFTVLGSCLLLVMLSLSSGYHIIDFLGKGLEEPLKITAQRLFIIMLPTMAFYPLVTVGSAVCNVKNRFLIPAMVPVLYNLTFLLGIIFSKFFSGSSKNAVSLTAFSVTAGVLIMVVTVWTDVFKNKLIKPKVPFVSHLDTVKSFAGTLIPYMLILGISLSIGYVERIIASVIGTGNISGLNYAYRISQLPVWVFAAAVGTVSFPAVARLKETSDKAFNIVVKGYIRSTFLIIVPLSVIIHILREPIVSILLSRGNFDASSVQITADILNGYSLAITGQSIFLVCMRFFIAAKCMTTPLFIVLLSSGVNGLADFLLKDIVGVSALGYGAAIGSVLNGICMLLLLDKKLVLGMKNELTYLFKILIACIPVGVVAFLSKVLWNTGIPDGPVTGKLLCGAGVMIVCAIAYFGSLHLLGVKNPLFLSHDPVSEKNRPLSKE